MNFELCSIRTPAYLAVPAFAGHFDIRYSSFDIRINFVAPILGASSYHLLRRWYLIQAGLLRPANSVLLRRGIFAPKPLQLKVRALLSPRHSR
jgi:hypothetical protein